MIAFYLFLISVLYMPVSHSLILPSSSARMRAILFDIDGTLCDSTPLCFDATNKILTHNGFQNIDISAYKAGSKYTTAKRFAWHAAGDPEAEIGNTLGEQFDNLYVDLVSQDSVPLFPGISSLVESIKKTDGSIKLGALTNACGAYARAVQSSHPVIKQCFEISLGVDDVPSPKPSGEGLLACCKALGIEPKEAIYIGDAPTDGFAAFSAGNPFIYSIC